MQNNFIRKNEEVGLARVETLNLFIEGGEEARVVEQARAAIGKATGR
jgi:hypothetical protein